MGRRLRQPPAVRELDSGLYLQGWTINAAIENIPRPVPAQWTCTGSVNIGGEEVTCPHAHGEQDIEEALANSCNGMFGQLAVELGGETMQKYADAAGLTKSIKVDGIQTSVGKVLISQAMTISWRGRVSVRVRIPCVRINMLQYMGAIANGGKAAVPRLIEKNPPRITACRPAFTIRISQRS